ncbi:nucleotidyltransferase domain-containing protein [uncultured Selenomonas sp.]|uniref:nucleotidyltransferase family protein n=1 Tax=uncultured Selenomonas sp. TaxID=159275 RepID=UPI0028F09CAD|nr:nucleotidyltransferase domain-containing protein [uncultured Selenomonas sp.]
MLSIPRIRECIAPICKKYPIRKAYLFGSYARGNATEKSDVDLRIEGDIKSFFMLGGIYSELSDALGTELDLLSRLPESEAFKKNLKKDEVLLYER